MKFLNDIKEAIKDPRNDLSIKDIRKKKEELAKAIEDLCWHFKVDTNLEVKHIDVVLYDIGRKAHVFLERL